MKTTRSENGSVTIMMVMIAAVIMTVALGFNWLVREHIHASEGLKSKAEAILKARSAYDTIIYLVMTGQFARKEIVVTGATDITDLKTLPLNGEAIRLAEGLHVRLQDTNGMISLSSLNTAPLERLIKTTEGMDRAAGPVNSFLDWVDPDTLTRIDGDEGPYYSGRGLPYGPRNYPPQYKEELGFIKGFDNGLYNRIQSYLTLLPATGFNPNTASDPVLMAALNLDDPSLKTLKEFMSRLPLASNAQLFALTGRKLDGEDNFSPSYFLDITVEAGTPKPVYCIRAGLKAVQNENAPYGIVYWSEQ